MAKYKRILLKLSGEALAAEDGFGIDAARANQLASEVLSVRRSGAQLAIVLGGGNFFRGIRAEQAGLRRVTVDYMGMLATVINALAFQDFLEAQGGKASVMSAVPMGSLAAPFSRRDAVGALEAGKVVIFAAGTGSPFFTTDTAAALRAVEIGADLLAKATKVDGVYDKDPLQFPDASRYERISYSEVLAGSLGVMDAAAVSLCKENNLPVVVFNFQVSGAMEKLAAGENVGTLVS